MPRRLPRFHGNTALYPTVGNLANISGADTSIAVKWANEPLIASELAAYCDSLAPGFNCDDERERHNYEILKNIKGGIVSIIRWPAAYD